MKRSSEFRQKEVININDGRRLGFVGDVEINLENGCVEAIVVPLGGKVFSMWGKNNDIVIPWENVKKVGEDIILVDMDERMLRKYFD